MASAPDPRSVQEAVIAVLEGNEDAKADDFLGLVEQLLSKILQNPQDKRLRKISRTSALYHQRIASVRGSERLFVSLGYEPQQQPSQFILSDSLDPLLPQLFSAFNQARLEYNQAIAAARDAKERERERLERERLEREHTRQAPPPPASLPASVPDSQLAPGQLDPAELENRLVSMGFMNITLVRQALHSTNFDFERALMVLLSASAEPAPVVVEDQVMVDADEQARVRQESMDLARRLQLEEEARVKQREEAERQSLQYILQLEEEEKLAQQQRVLKQQMEQQSLLMIEQMEQQEKLADELRKAQQKAQKLLENKAIRKALREEAKAGRVLTLFEHNLLLALDHTDDALYQCLLCGVPYLLESVILLSECEHVFCIECFQTNAWTKMGAKFLCPQPGCNAEVKEEDARLACTEAQLKRLQQQKQKAQQDDVTIGLMEREQKAIAGGQFVLIDIRPSKSFMGNTPEELHFRLAESQFFRMCGQNAAQYQVTLVQYIVNPALKERYEQFKQEQKNEGHKTEEYLTFHGTSQAAIDNIVREGFKIGGQGVPVASGAVHGHGVYVSEDPNFAMAYIKDGKSRLLFVRVCPSQDSKFVRQGNVIQQLILRHTQQVLPAYIVHYGPRGN